MTSADELVRAALEARKASYSPYSLYAVGAALRTADGRVFTGCNVENASYGLSVCAERTAILTAVAAGAREIVAIAVATETSPPAAPCGLCRQMLAEFASDMPIVLVNERGERRETSLAQLLPMGFRAKDLLERK